MSHDCQCASTDNWEQVLVECQGLLTPDIVKYIDQVRQQEHGESNLISVLHKVQEHFGFLGQTQLNAVAQLMRIPVAKVTGVATFYHFFRMTPRGQHTINICLGTACYVRGASAVADRLKDELGIDFGQTTKDGKFSLEASRCLGTCGLAPVVMIDEQIHGQVRPENIPVLLQKYRQV